MMSFVGKVGRDLSWSERNFQKETTKRYANCETTGFWLHINLTWQHYKAEQRHHLNLGWSFSCSRSDKRISAYRYRDSCKRSRFILPQLCLKISTSVITPTHSPVIIEPLPTPAKKNTSTPHHKKNNAIQTQRYLWVSIFLEDPFPFSLGICFLCFQKTRCRRLIVGEACIIRGCCHTIGTTWVFTRNDGGWGGVRDIFLGKTDRSWGLKV